MGDAAFSAIGRRSSEAKVQAQQDEDVPHPARLYIDLLPGEATDDPLLAVCASAMLGVVDEACRENEGVATLSQIFEGMLNLGVSPDEVDEALDPVDHGTPLGNRRRRVRSLCRVSGPRVHDPPRGR